ncbi:MAG: enoyl-CoA hydratase/isomerase family protein, partial [Panacagrimonas sp.]
MTEVLRIERRQACAWLRMTRPAAMNAVNLELIDAMRSTLAALAADRDVRVLLLTGSGSAFCAGADLKEVLAGRNLPP